MLSINQLQEKSSNLQDRSLPPVNKFQGFSGLIKDFLYLDVTQQYEILAKSRDNFEEHGKFIHESLGLIYAYVLGYEDSPCYITTNEELEIKLQQLKIVLERELMNYWLDIPVIPQQLNQVEAVDYLNKKILDNSGVYHELFDYIATKASKTSVITFLQNEVIRNEVVDDEVALLVKGLQGLLKKVVASNLWDECGRGKLNDFHTYWLRMLLEELNGWNQLSDYRKLTSPWYAKITSNSFNMLLTRPGYKYMAYGAFLIFESWVHPHFERIIAGLKRVGIDQEDLSIYFTAHLAIDQYHTRELLAGIANQEPRLNQAEVDQILLGSHLAIAAGTAQYGRMLSYLSTLK